MGRLAGSATPCPQVVGKLGVSAADSLENNYFIAYALPPAFSWYSLSSMLFLTFLLAPQVEVSRAIGMLVSVSKAY